MKSLKAAIGALTLACAAIVAPVVHAQTLQVMTAGSSAQFGPFAVAAYQLAKAGKATAYHYTFKTSSCTAAVFTCVNDTRGGTGATAIPPEPGNIWVVWSTNGVWAYLSIDSTVGVRSFLAYPRTTLSIAPLATMNTPAASGGGLSATTNYTYWADGTNDSPLTSTVYAALSGKAFTAANTDIRPEDALFATNRYYATYNYTTPIQSYFSTALAHPVKFSLSTGVADPVSGQTIPAANAWITIPIGAAPIVFLASESLSAATNLKVKTTGFSDNAAALFDGSGDCAGNLLDGIASTVALSPILREPLSGTYNTAEFTAFDLTGGVGGAQQNGITTNPGHQPCGSGFRDRAIGTGEEVKAVGGNATLLHVATNPVGYAFFSYESTGASSAYKYITLDGVDPINASYSTGALPSCAVVSGQYSCPIANGSSFPNLRNGKYRSWSIYRLVTDASHKTAAQTLVTEAQTLVNSNIPDFVPFSPVCKVTGGTSDPGLAVYRQHFTPSGITLPYPGPNDGPIQASVHCTVGGVTTLPYRTLGGQGSTNTESGGDAGGVIEGPYTGNPTPYPGPTGTRQ